MANVMRKRLPADQAQMTFECGPTVAVEVGDLLYVVADLAVPVSGQADLGTLAQNQEGIHDAFLGVSLSAHRAAVTDFVNDSVSLDVAIEGVFSFPCVSSAGYVRGDFVGVEGTGVALAVGMDDQKVVKVATANLSIGKVFRVISATEIWVEICSTVMRNGLQAVA